MDDMQLDKKSYISHDWLPYAVGLVGVLVSVLVWFMVIYERPHHDYLLSLVDLIPWIILILGCSVATLSGLAIRLAQVTKQRKRSLAIINANFKNEIAERIHAEETKQKLEKALLQGQKLQAIGTLAGGIAHDFNNLLYAIIGYVEMAREDVPNDAIVYKNLGKVLEASKRGQELVARILQFGRRQHHEFSALYIENTIEGVLGLLKPTIPASVVINFIPVPQDFTVLGNQTQLHQVLVNIINNAVDAMDGEGTINIRVELIEPSDELLKEFPKIENVNYCKIQITDTGHGMDQATMHRIFEPFYTTKEVGKGTGLGLATAHSIINEHRGEILVSSQLGRGTTFTLLLPELPKENEHGKDFIG